MDLATCAGKINVDPAQSDKKVFSRMPMGDTWDDAESAFSL